MSTAKVIAFPTPQNQPIEPPKEVRVADCDDGYTRLANDLYEELIGADLTRNQAKVAHAICRKTYGFNKKSDRISDSQLSVLTKLPRQKVNKAKNELIAMNVIVHIGREIGPNKNISEWKTDCHQNSDMVTKTGTKTVTKTVTGLSPKQGHTKDTLKDNKEKTPLPPCGGSQSADAELPAAEHKKTIRKKSPAIDYQAFADAYNETLGDQLPNCAVMNDKRKRALKKLLGLLREPTVECFTAYLRGFAKRAGPFYFGDNDRGWMASIDYLLREDTLTKTKEGSLLGGLTGEDDE